MSAQMRSPAPRANAGNRAEVIRNDASLITAHAERKVISPRFSSPGGMGSLCRSRGQSSHWRASGGPSHEGSSRLRRDQSSGVGGLPRRAESAVAARQGNGARACRPQPAPGRSQSRLVQDQSTQRPVVRFRDWRQGRRSRCLVAYLADVSQGEAARLLAQMLGIETGGRRHG